MSSFIPTQLHTLVTSNAVNCCYNSDWWWKVQSDSTSDNPTLAESNRIHILSSYYELLLYMYDTDGITPIHAIKLLHTSTTHTSTDNEMSNARHSCSGKYLDLD